MSFVTIFLLRDALSVGLYPPPFTVHALGNSELVGEESNDKLIQYTNQVTKVIDSQKDKIVHSQLIDSVRNFGWPLNQCRCLDYSVNLLGQSPQARSKVWIYGGIAMKKRNNFIYQPT